MRVIRQIEAYYPQFHLGCEPRAVLCTLSVVEANGNHYLKTPFAMLSADADCDLAFWTQPGRGYYATEADCMAYLAAEYPHWRDALPIMELLFESRRHYGDIVGPSRAADKCLESSFEIHQLARGHRKYKRQSVRKAAKLAQA